MNDDLQLPIESTGSTPRLKHHLKALYSGGTPDTATPEYWSSDESGVAWVAVGDMSGRERVEATGKRITELGRQSRSLAVLPAGTLIYSMYATLGHVAELGIDATINQALVGFDFKPGVDKQYVKWQLRYLQPRVVEDSRSSTQDNLSAERVRNLAIPMPALAQQRAIADYLDRETKRLDALVAAKERMLGLLAEKRRALITRAVTRGLDPHTPLRDSGIPGLGEIPANWRVIPLMWLTQPDRPIMYGIVLPGPDVSDGIPILKGGNVRPSRMNLASLARTPPEIEAPYARARLRASDLVYSIRGSICDCEIVPSELDGCNITQDVARVAPRSDVNVAWLRYALICTPVREALAAGSLGAAVRGINIFDLKRVRIPTPPPMDQALLVAHLTKTLDKLEVLAQATEQTVHLIKERRAALIAAAVIGQVDI